MRSGRSSPGSPTTAAEFFAALRASQVLPSQHIDDLKAETSVHCLEAPGLARTLVERGVLTAYQADELLAGSGEALRLGQYRILDRLGVGGMSRVYKAEHLLMKRVIALKLLAVPWGQDRSALTRFSQEVQAAGQLCHPNIVTAHDAAEVDGVPFLVMEYVDGRDLECLVQEEGPLPIPLAGECIRQVALGLQHAYERGFVHGDIKPSNLLLQRRAESAVRSAPGTWLAREEGFPLVKILDLGLARSTGAPLLDLHASSGGRGEGSFAGTPDYLAPEQARSGQAADIRSDLYSLGATFYYLLTGQVPFPGGSVTEKLLRHQLDPVPPVTDLRPETPAAIAALVQRLLAKDPAERFALPVAVAQNLHEWLCLQQNTDAAPLPALRGRRADTRPALDSPTVLSPQRDAEPAILLFPREQEEEASRDADETPAPDSRSPRRRRGLRLSWSAAVSLAMVIGFGAAWLARHSPTADWTTPPVASPAPGRQPAFVTVASLPGSTFAGLEGAVAAAQDGDTLLLHGDGPFRTRPLTIQGKALTLQAAAGSQPRVELGPAHAECSWQALLATDRPLVLEGLELRRGGSDETFVQTGAAYLVYADPAQVRLVRCRLLAPQGSALLVCRQTRQLELADCLLVAQASACCVEVGDGPAPVLELRGNAFQVTDRRGAALAVWASEERGPGSVQLHLEGNTMEAGRMASLAGLVNGVDIRAEDNLFTFHEALLSFVGFPGPDGCRRATRWWGERNRYQAGADWLWIDGKPADIRSLKEWQETWQIRETGSWDQLPLPSVRASSSARSLPPALPY